MNQSKSDVNAAVKNSFGARTIIDGNRGNNGNSRPLTIFNPDAVPGAETLPYCLKVLVENLLRHEDGNLVKAEDITKLVQKTKNGKTAEIAFFPARVLMQDFTGVPALVDLAAMREVAPRFGLNPADINPMKPAELVIDHSLRVDKFASADALDLNTKLEFNRNRERYRFLKWGKEAFANLQVVPPGSGIVHQLNLELLAKVVATTEEEGETIAFPDTLVGTDSHTTMINGIGVLGWGVGGIEAEAVMLGQSLSLPVPTVVGVRLEGNLLEGTTATDLVLRIVELLREYNVVGKFVEFHGPALDHLSLGDRATISNMAPEYGATCGFFPIDEQCLQYLHLTGRDKNQVQLVETYSKATGLWRDDNRQIHYDEELSLDLASVRPSLAGPYRPQDRISLEAVADSFTESLAAIKKSPDNKPNVNRASMSDGMVAIAAITSCTNTSNPSVMLAAGLVAQKAVALGLEVKPWVKTSLAPGSRAVSDYLSEAGLAEPLQQLGFHTVGYGCTTCIGNSGPLLPEISQVIKEKDLVAVSVLSGNRNFEGRIHPEVRLNYLASPPLVVVYAIAGNMSVDVFADPVAWSRDGNPVYLRDLWPQSKDVLALEKRVLSMERFKASYKGVFRGEENWAQLEGGSQQLFDWQPSSYIVHPPYLEGVGKEPASLESIKAARTLLCLGDSVTTDHVSPAGAIAEDSPAGRYLKEKGVSPGDFNSYGSRRGNHEVMMRGTFANIRLRNKLVPGVEGGFSKHFPSGEVLPVYDVAMRYKADNIPAIVLAGKEYGTGSSRDWAAKGPMLLGVRAVIAESYERIHRSNLIGMGILPLQFQDGETAESLGLDGSELYDIAEIAPGQKSIELQVTTAQAGEKTFVAKIRLDTTREEAYFQHGGILPYVMRQLGARHDAARAG